MKAQTSIDPKLIALLGRKLYSGHPVPIVVRELLQNSVDACIRAGVTPEIEITVEQIERNKVTITCEDNGCGMSPEELVNDFLCLGGTNKRGTQSTGGFGIAKAAIMSGTYWEVQTLNWVVTSEDVLEGGDIRENDIPRKGTKVFVVIEEDTWAWHLDECVSMVYASEVDIHFRITHRNISSYNIDDEHAGLKVKKVSLMDTDRWCAYMSEPIDLKTVTIRGKAFVRLNGLVQFQYCNFNDKRKSLIMLDVYSNESPDSKSYPLTISRERLNEDYSTEISDFLSRYEGEGASADDELQRSLYPPNVSILSGKMLKGLRDYSNNESYAGSENTTSPREWVSFIRISSMEAAELESYVDDFSKSPIMKLVDYKPTEETLKRDTNLLFVWCHILKNLLPEGYEFGVGFVGESGTYAMLNVDFGMPFFLINPTVLESAYTTEGKILSMWSSACHESAHLRAQKHDQAFCSIWTFLMKSSADFITMEVAKLSKVLEGRMDIDL